MLWALCMILGSVFAVAGLAKLRDPAVTTKAFNELGIPPRIATEARFLLPLVELAVAGMLFVPFTAVVGAAIGASLLVVFSLIISIRLAKGERPSCNCFGRLTTGQIGPGTLVRNGVLLVLAGLIAVGGWGHPERLRWMSLKGVFTPEVWLVMSIAAVSVAIVIFQTRLILRLMRRHGLLLERIDKLEATLDFEDTADSIGLAVGTQAPNFRLEGVDGGTVTLGDLLARGKPLLLVFTDPGCVPCSTLIPDVGQWQRDLVEELSIALIAQGDREAVKAYAAEYGLRNVLIQVNRETAEAFRSPGTPSAVMIGADGTIRSQFAAGVDVIRSRVEATRKAASALRFAHPSGDGDLITQVVSSEEGGNDG